MPSCYRSIVAARRPYVLVALFALVLVVAAAPSLRAQDDGDEQDQTAAANAQQTADDTTGQPNGDAADASKEQEQARVLCAYRLESTRWGEAKATDKDTAKGVSTAGAGEAGDEQEAAGETNPGEEDSEILCPGQAAAGLGDRIALHVDHLPVLLAAVKCEKVVLFIDRTPLEGTPPAYCLPSQGELVFDLVRGEEDDDDWHALLGSPQGLSRAVSVSVGPAAETMLDSDVDDFELRVLSPLALTIFLVLLAVALGGFLNLATTTPMLRDGQSTAAGQNRPYSLARCQMAWWFFLVIAAFGFLYMVLGELDSITGPILGLIGISSGTALGAVAIDSSKKASQKEAEQKTAALRTTLDSASTKASLGGPSNPQQLTVMMDASTRLAQAASAATDMQGAVKGRTRGPLQDLLWDGQGISFHRFQIVVWTFALGVIFVWSVYTDLEMPEFSTTLLALMGISSGTYLGFKFPERFEDAGGGAGGGGGGNGGGGNA